MAKIPGAISITGLLAPNDSADTYAITDEKYGKGGYRSVANISERDAITSERRTEGMLVKVLADGKFYTLSGGVLNANWIEQVMGGSTGGGGETVTGTAPISVTNNVVSISEATILAPGSMSAADKVTLNSLVSFPGFGTTGTTATVGNDSRLSDARTPVAHNQAESTITFTDITTGNASTSSHGYLKKLSNVSTEFLNGQGNWATPSGGGSTLTPASSVTSETSYGISSSVGTSLNYARQDHTHGTPASTKDTTSVTGILYGNATTISAATTGNFPILNQNTTGSAATLTTARTITIGATGKTFNGSGNVTWTLGEIGAQAAGSYLTGNQTITLSGAVTGSGATSIATTLATGIVGISNLSATGTANSTTYLRGDNTWQAISPGGVTSVSTDGTAITGGPITSTGTISHSTSDGYKHVPATGTTNSGKVLTAGATAGAMTWETPQSVTPADNSITNAKLAQVATGTIKGRKTAATGNVEDLTAAEVRTLISVDTDPIPLYCSDMASDLKASTTVQKLRFMFEEARTLQSVVGSLLVATAGSVLTVDIKHNNVSIFSTLLTFDAGENTTRTATTAAVLTGTISFAIGDYIDVYVTTVGSVTAGRGLLITLLTKR